MLNQSINDAFHPLCVLLQNGKFSVPTLCCPYTTLGPKENPLTTSLPGHWTRDGECLTTKLSHRHSGLATLPSVGAVP